jgi:acetyl-CoA C-acetyltransferase
MRNVVLAGAVRTPIGKFGGSLLPLSAPDLGVAAARAALRRSGVPATAVDETIFGHARQAGQGPSTGRQVSVRSGVPVETPAWTVNMACGSSLKAVILASEAIAAGRADVVLAGGIESMSNTPYLDPKARFGHRLGTDPLVDGMYRDGFLCPLAGQLMGETAENLVPMYAISRAEQDEYAARSQQRCEAARKRGRFEPEKTPVEIPAKGGPKEFLEDEHPRDGVTAASLASLAPVFSKAGTVHAGNSSGITDGGSAIVVLSEEAASRHDVPVMARILGAAQAGVDPKVMGLGPVPAVRRLLEKSGLRVEDVDLWELNEAFAAQVIACNRELKIPEERLNVDGGSIALGHPIGATGCRILVTLLHSLAERGLRRGVATLCISGGLGLALLVERTS